MPEGIEPQRIAAELPSGLKSRPVFVSDHAKERLYQRCPDVRNEKRVLHSLVVSEVHAALSEGRYSKSLPKWTQQTLAAGRKKMNRNPGGNGRVVWNADETRAYLLRLVDDHLDPPRSSDGKGWLVVSVVPRFGVGR